MSPDASAAAAPVSDQPRNPAAQRFADIVGFIDSIGGSRVSGWVWDRQRPGDKVDVDVRLDGQPVATVQANRPRPDLEKANIGDGAYGFEVQLPEKLLKEEYHRVSAIVRMPGAGGDVRLKNQAAVNTEALALRPSDYTALVEQLEQCVEDQRAGFRWIYQELHNLDEFVRSDARAIPTIAAAPTPVAAEEAPAAMRIAETQYSELVQNQSILHDTLEAIASSQKTLSQRLEQLDVCNARIDAHLVELQRSRDDDPDYTDNQRGLKRLVFFLGCLTLCSLAIGVKALLG